MVVEAAGLNGSATTLRRSSAVCEPCRCGSTDRKRARAKFAAWLSARTEVEAIHFPGLETSRGREIVAAQQSGPGFVLSFELIGGKAAAERFVAALKLINLAPSLGGFSTLICTPASMTHRGMSPEAQREAGISQGLLRISVGLEDGDDLIQDLSRAFAALAP